MKKAIICISDKLTPEALEHTKPLYDIDYVYEDWAPFNEGYIIPVYYSIRTDDISNKNIFRILCKRDFLEKDLESKMNFELSTDDFCKQCLDMVDKDAYPRLTCLSTSSLGTHYYEKDPFWVTVRIPSGDEYIFDKHNYTCNSELIHAMYDDKKLLARNLRSDEEIDQMDSDRLKHYIKASTAFGTHNAYYFYDNEFE